MLLNEFIMFYPQQGYFKLKVVIAVGSNLGLRQPCGLHTFPIEVEVRVVPAKL
jgi:hypothetical protein